ncbi:MULTISPECIES: AMP-binding protein [Alphaproteobacteria]|uniref:Acetyl-CoA synthetase n=2 Tax=Alphaproteobacteria TaxID=28211 RepID=A0A512HLM5_9HYPH|nr:MULTISPECIES: AMP-binding protein [Alphaproteobacteria]GEO86341.1 acetyl-CoA synthetase [Ciceribacter naphthalenivorans]GLR21823.1 acetyl-CoA synthetase [Ciceribacter naphthalenivorans]GLT04679.1 acetyl-CoA synthetase [Sphingomonas psychrolutea]
MFLPESSSYDRIFRDFSWEIPENFNIGRVVSDDWARRDPDRICLEHFSADGNHLSMTYGTLAARSAGFANSLTALGVQPGDRVALLLPQSFETVIAHVAIYKMGAVALPLALLFGAEALEYRLVAASAKAIVTNDFGLSRLEEIRSRLPALEHVISTAAAAGEVHSFAALVDAQPPVFAVADTGPDTPALMIFTSGTTGPPKGALHGHRVLPGHIPGFQMVHDFLPRDGDKMWTPSDWAWAGGLLNALLPALMLGVPVVSSPAQKFDPHTAFRIMSEMKVRNAFIPPTALRLLKSVDRPLEKYDLVLRSIGSAGESLGRETYEWVKATLGIVPNEFYGQTECNFVLGSAARLGVTRAGAIGRAVPGHRVAIIDDEGREVPSGETGEVAIARPDPVMFLGYWNDEDATARKFVGDWMKTGDLGRQDENGYVEFFGRDDDVITSAGYRIGPAEIEDCLAGHPAVRLAAAVGKPDPLRTEIVKAFIVVADGYVPSPALADEISEWVKQRLSMHEYPREVEFIDEMPLTTSGKVIRRLLRDRELAIAAE